MARRLTLTRSAADYLPTRPTLATLRRAAAVCRGCDLYARATQTVFGEGPMDADVMLVGEIPGDEEDRQGRPFVGPAGKLLDRTLVDVGLCRSDVYLTNVVKHFSWQPRGKRRLHKKPRRIEVLSCRAWIDAELLIVRPKVVVCLGATAAQVLLGNKYRISRHRGEVVSFVSAGLDTSIAAVASWHPSAILRARTSLSRSKMQAELAMDLRRARDAALSAR